MPVNEHTLKNKGHLLKIVKKFPKELNLQIWSRMISAMDNRLKVGV